MKSRVTGTIGAVPAAGALTAAGVLVATSMFGAGCAAPRAGASSTPTGLDAAGSIYVFESDAAGFNTKTIFYDTGAEVVAFDAQFTPELARQAIAFLRAKTDRPLRYLVITHPNPDKFNGLAAFQQAGAKVVASAATVEAMPRTHDYKRNFFVNVAGMFTADGYPTLGRVDQTFVDVLDLPLASGKVSLRRLKAPGVSSTQTVAWLPESNVLVVGDLIHHRAHAWLEGGIVGGKPVPTIAAWIRDLDELRQRYGREDPLVHGGRGEPARLGEAARAQADYLRTADALVGGYVAALGDRRGELSGPAASAHFAGLTAAMQAQYPDYGLAYMIQYGVYGLALAK